MGSRKLQMVFCGLSPPPPSTHRSWEGKERVEGKGVSSSLLLSSQRRNGPKSCEGRHSAKKTTRGMEFNAILNELSSCFRYGIQQGSWFGAKIFKVSFFRKLSNLLPSVRRMRSGRQSSEPFRPTTCRIGSYNRTPLKKLPSLPQTWTHRIACRNG